MCSPTKENVKQNISYHFKDIVQLSPEGEVNSGGYIYRDAKVRGIVVLVCNLPNQLDKTEKKVTLCKLKLHLAGTLFTIYKHLRVLSSAFYDFVAKSA